MPEVQIPVGSVLQFLHFFFECLDALCFFFEELDGLGLLAKPCRDFCHLGLQFVHLSRAARHLV